VLTRREDANRLLRPDPRLLCRTPGYGRSADGHSDGHGDIATDGFYDLDLRFVEAMTGARLRWGGQMSTGKDLMHFDWDHAGDRGPPKPRLAEHPADRDVATTAM
jgi:hypothetical protein